MRHVATVSSHIQNKNRDDITDSRDRDVQNTHERAPPTVPSFPASTTLPHGTDNALFMLWRSPTCRRSQRRKATPWNKSRYDTQNWQTFRRRGVRGNWNASIGCSGIFSVKVTSCSALFLDVLWKVENVIGLYGYLYIV